MTASSDSELESTV